jgi:L-Lysine epsilon oxidase N-terminal/L-lysine epsilon oxidase C-terminal domain
MRTITSIKIHPSIGIARIGNSPTEFFIGPEKPGARTRPKGGYRDAEGRIKRQAARFRLFGYDKKGNLVKEITRADASVEWTVHLANRKADWREFDGLNSSTPLRNAGIASRTSLVIDPGERTATGSNQRASFDTGAFLGVTVPLGEMRTDNRGRLLVLGGFGNSGSPTDKPLQHWANNDEWHDDVSDGPVNATVTFKRNGQTINAVGAWVICAPPSFAPPLDHVITLYDVLLQMAVDKLGLKRPVKPSFTKDIYPLLQRAINTKWVSAMVADPEAHEHGNASRHEHGTPSSATPAHASFKAVIPPPGTATARRKIFDKLRNPALPYNKDSGESDMPMIWSDYYLNGKNEPLTKIQYGYIKKWKNGNFINDWHGPSKPPKQITPAGLDRAALEGCIGAPLYPGIEASWLLRDAYTFSEPFRLNHSNLEAGDITKQMAVPWQADFYDCSQEGELAWWPAQRPDDVFPETGGPQVPWIRHHVSSRSGMVKNWHKLGFVVKRGAKYVETERNP